jgi:hypothetical protein
VQRRLPPLRCWPKTHMNANRCTLILVHSAASRAVKAVSACPIGTSSPPEFSPDQNVRRTSQLEHHVSSKYPPKAPLRWTATSEPVYHPRRRDRKVDVRTTRTRKTSAQITQR